MDIWQQLLRKSINSNNTLKGKQNDVIYSDFHEVFHQNYFHVLLMELDKFRLAAYVHKVLMFTVI